MTVARTRVEENTARRGFCEFIGKIIPQPNATQTFMQQNQSRRRLRPRPNHAELQMLVVDVQEAGMSDSLAFSGFFRTTKAFGLMSFCSSCQPTTAASSTSGCDDKAASTSNGETYIPETFNMSSARPQQT